MAIAKVNECYLKSNDFSELPYWEVMIQRADEDNILDNEVSINSQLILAGDAYKLLVPGQTVTKKNEMNEGALSFNGLKECGCEILGRRENNPYRHQYESRLLDELDQYKDSETIRIAAFATGLLFGEYVLLTKIINKLSINNFAAKYVVFDCVDTAYEAYWSKCEGVLKGIQNAVSWRNDLLQAIPAFVDLIQKTINCSQAKFKIELRFFSQIYCLLQHSFEQNTKYLLLIGADRNDTDKVIKDLNQELKCSSVFLERRKDIPYIQAINAQGQQKLTPL